MTYFLSYADLRDEAERMVIAHGGQSAAARTLGVSQSAVAQALSGKRPMIDLLTRVLVEIGGAIVEPVYRVTGLQRAHELIRM